MPANVMPSWRRRAAIVATYLLTLGAVCAREWMVAVRPYLFRIQQEGGLPYPWALYLLVAILFAVVFPAVVLLLPAWERHLRPIAMRWQPTHTALLMLGTAVILCVAIAILGMRQFGAFDESIVVDTLWRQVSGQVPYRDFVTTNPPLFVLGLGLAGRLFGANWTAQICLQCIFSAATLLWSFWLLRQLDLQVRFAWLVSVTAQVSGMVVLSFWWFNSTTAVIAGIFTLTTMLLLYRPDLGWPARLQWGTALAVLLLTKPNTAGLLSFLAVLLVLVAVPRRLWTLGMIALAVAADALLLLLFHVRPADVLHSYAGVARSRALAVLGIHINSFFTAEAAFVVLCCSAILLVAAPAYLRAHGDAAFSRLAMPAAALMGCLAGLLALLSNGDLPSVSMAPILLAIGAIACNRFVCNRAAGLVCTAFLCTLLVAHSLEAHARLRNWLIGMYYAEATVPVQNPFFQHLRTGAEMNEVLAQLGQALPAAQGPVFFGSRLEWAYAAFQQPSPAGLPVFWQAGTSYAPSGEAQLAARWENDRFPTVITSRLGPFGKDDWIAFPASLQEKLAAEYDRDDHTYSHLVIWRRK